MLLVLLPEETYDHVNARLRTLWRAGEVERLKGMHACVYSRSKGKQLPHRLARSYMHLCTELFCRQSPAYQYEWVNESGKRQDLVVADATLRLWNAAFELRYKVEIDQSTENIVHIVNKMSAHLTQREAARTLPDYQPYRILFATNNVDNRLHRVLRRMAEVEASRKVPHFILYTAQERYTVEHPASLFCAPIWHTAHNDQLVALID